MSSIQTVPSIVEYDLERNKVAPGLAYTEALRRALTYMSALKPQEDAQPDYSVNTRATTSLTIIGRFDQLRFGLVKGQTVPLSLVHTWHPSVLAADGLYSLPAYAYEKPFLLWGIPNPKRIQSPAVGISFDLMSGPDTVEYRNIHGVRFDPAKFAEI